MRDLCVFAALGAILFASQIAFQALPNIHPLGLLIAAYTLSYRARALIPLYVYVLLYGAFYGFSLWWLPYLYVWLPLWAMFMLAGRLHRSKGIRVPLYMFLCGFHGLSFGALYAPAQALLFGLSFRGMLAWIAAGLPFDIIHAIGNTAAGVLIMPLASLLRKLEERLYIS